MLKAPKPLKSNGVLTPFPSRMLVSLRSNAQAATTIDEGDRINQFLLTPNSAIDPLHTAGNAQGQGFDQLRTIYNRNIVHRARVIIQVSERAQLLNNDTLSLFTGPAQVSPAGTYDGTHLIQHAYKRGFSVFTTVNQTPSLLTSYDHFINQPDVIGATGNIENPVTIMRYIDIPAHFGVAKDDYNPERFGATFALNPLALLYLHVGIADELQVIASGSQRNFTIDVQVVQLMEVYAPITLQPSVG